MEHNLTISNNGINIQIMLLLLSHGRAKAFDQWIQITAYMNQIGKIELFFHGQVATMFNIQSIGIKLPTTTKGVF
jgi:hypothetical protein